MIKPSYPKPVDAQATALSILGWIVSDTGRCARFFDLTGLDPDQLRAGIATLSVQGAAFDYLMGHEPDLMACASALDLSPEQIVAAAGALRA